jgi:hypothetical protein
LTDVYLMRVRRGLSDADRASLTPPFLRAVARAARTVEATPAATSANHMARPTESNQAIGIMTGVVERP